MNIEDPNSWEQEGIVDKIAVLKDKILQNKLTRYFLSAVFLVFAILLFLPILVNNDALKGNSIKKLREVLGHDVLIKGDMNIELLPTPKIVARDILVLNYRPKGSKYNYNVFIKKAEFKLKIFSFDNDILKEVRLISMIMEKIYDDKNKNILGSDIQNIKTSMQNKYGSTTSKIDKSSAGISFEALSLNKVNKNDFSLNDFPRVSIIDSKVISYDIYSNKREYNSLNCLVDIDNSKLKSQGYFAVEDILTSFESKLVFEDSLLDSNNSYVQIKSPSLNFRFDGDLAINKGSGKDFAIKGSVISEIKDIRDFYLSYIGAKGGLSKKLKNNTPMIKLSAKISSNKDGSFIEDLTIKSPIVNGKGTASMHKTSTVPIIDVLLDIRDIDIDSMWSTDVLKIDNEGSAEENIGFMFGIDNVETFLADKAPEIRKKDFDLTLEIKSDLATYKNTTLADLNIYLNSNNYGQLIINPISFRFPGNGRFHANGELNGSSGAPKFVGKINISGDNPDIIFTQDSNSKLNLDFISKFQLYSNLVLEQNKMNFDNLFINLNNKETEISGDLIYSISNNKPFLKGNFRIDDFDIKHQIKNFNLTKYTKGGSLIEKVFWLNDLSHETDLALKFDKVHYDKEEFLDNSLDLKIKRGSIELENIIFDPAKNDVKANFIVDISQAVPKFDFNIKAKKLAFLSEDKKLSIPQYVANKDGVIEVVNSNPNYDPNLLIRQHSFDQFFNIVSLNGFSGKLNVNIQNFLFKNKSLRNFIVNSKLNNGILDNVLIQGVVDKSSFKYTGSVGLRHTKTISGVATVNNFKIQPIAKDLFNITNIDAMLNASISFSSFGSNREDFAKNIDGELKFSAIAPEITGYGLRDLIRKMFFPKKNLEELKEPEKIINNSEAKTIFRSASGSMVLKKGTAKIYSKVKGILSNSVLSGNIGLVKGDVSLSFNTVFMTGSKKKLAPISIARNISGNVGNFTYASNYDQIMQYLGLKEVKKEKTDKDIALQQQNIDKSKVEAVYTKKELEKIAKDRSNKANSVLKKHGISLP